MAGETPAAANPSSRVSGVAGWFGRAFNVCCIVLLAERSVVRVVRGDRTPAR
jgi:hypothetical protein